MKGIQDAAIYNIFDDFSEIAKKMKKKFKFFISFFEIYYWRLHPLIFLFLNLIWTLFLSCVSYFINFFSLNVFQESAISDFSGDLIFLTLQGWYIRITLVVNFRLDSKDLLFCRFNTVLTPTPYALFLRPDTSAAVPFTY